MASVRIQHGLFGLFGMLWLCSALSITGGLEISTIPRYRTTCGENVTLLCTVTAETDPDIKRFYWMENDMDICDWNGETNQTETECISKVIFNSTNRRVYSFQLTIFNVQPKHEGTYHCKLRAKEGMKNNKTILRVQMCSGTPFSNVTDTEVKVTFPDVFPKPSMVVWTQGQPKITFQATPEITENAEGKFTVVSSIKREPSDPIDYNCSLLMKVEKETGTEEMRVQRIHISARHIESAGHTARAHWFSVFFLMGLGML